MIPLTNRSSTTITKLQAFLGGAAATTNPTVTVGSYIVPPQSKTVTGPNGSIAGDPSEYRSAPQFTVLAGATETDIADAPPEGSVKNINYISIYNTDTASVTVTVCVDDNATNRLLIKATLATLETLYYEDGKGWYSTDSNGAIKTALGTAGQFSSLTVSGNTTLGDAAADSLTINAGVYSAPNIPCFLAYNSTTDTNQTGNGATATVDFDTEVFDQGSNFSGDTFTAPQTGRYLLSTMVTLSALTAVMTNQIINLITSNRTYTNSMNDTPIAGGNWVLSIDQICDMDSGDTVTVTARVNGGVGDTASILGSSTLQTCFSGMLVA